MARNTKAIETLRNYFEQKGRVLSSQEYARESDTPIRIQQLRAMFGSWNKVEKLVMARPDSDAITDIDDVLAARNRAAAEAEAQWKEASENQDAKAQREAEANALAEKLALLAATPQGANAIKVALGGPLPAEQPKLERVGATVNVDPETLERTVVDPKAEDHVVETETRTGLTPVELKDAAKADLDAGTVNTGDATDGGSQGSASIATAAALGGTDEVDASDSSTVKTTPAKK